MGTPIDTDTEGREGIGREAPADDALADAEAHRELAVDALRDLARKHDEARRAEEKARTPPPMPIPVRNATPVDRASIRPEMKVMSAAAEPVAVVDCVDSLSTVRLKDATGIAHRIPLLWVAHVDEVVHLDRSLAQVMQEWTLAA